MSRGPFSRFPSSPRAIYFSTVLLVAAWFLAASDRRAAAVSSGVALLERVLRSPLEPPSPPQQVLLEANAQQSCLKTNTRLFGGDLFGAQLSNAEECQKACQETSMCNNFDFNVSTQRCNLKTNDVCERSNISGHTSGPKTCGGAVQDFAGGGVGSASGNVGNTRSAAQCRENDTNRPGNDIISYSSGIDRCEQDCLDRSDCLAWTFFKPCGICYLKRSEGTAQIGGCNGGNVSGTRRCREGN